MSVALAAAERSVVSMIGKAYSGEEEVGVEADAEPSKFDFSDDFQSRIAALSLRDDEFMRRSSHLLKPEYFENLGEAALVNVMLKHFAKYGSVPTTSAQALVIKDAILSKVIRKDVVPLVIEARKRLLAELLTDRAYVEDKLVAFVRRQAVSQAILKSVDLIDTGDFDKIETLIKNATEIGINEEGDAYDYFEKIADRTEYRIDKAAGKMIDQGITTGNRALDALLYHQGWGRRELATVMGGAKAGKTTALINFAKSGSLAGYHVLYVTLEVSAKIISERLDASISDELIKELGLHIRDVEERVRKLGKNAGKLLIHEFGSGTLSPATLHKLIDKYKSKGTKFDLVVVDYADIMAPNHRTDNSIENSKSVYIDLRAIAFNENIAMLTATQTNREGFKATVAKAEHVSEDFNKVRTVDLMISINSSDEEKARGEARLYFAASRNQESGFTVFIKQDLAKMQFLKSVIRVE